MGNSESDLSNAAGSSNEDLGRKKKEKDDEDALDMAKMVAVYKAKHIIGNSESVLSNAAGSSNEDLGRKKKEKDDEDALDMAKMVAVYKAMHVMGNSESDLSNAAGSSKEDLGRKKKEKDDEDMLNMAIMVAAVGVGALAVGALAGWGLTKLLSSSSSGAEEELDTHEDRTHEMLEANDGRLIRWRFPACGKLKMNTDGSVINSKDGFGGRAGFGGVIRDEIGSCIMCFYGKLRDDCLILEAELWAIYKGLKIIRGRNLREVEIESDSKAAINLIKNVKNDHMKEIRMMLSSTGCTLKHTLREGNRVADKLAKLGRDGDSNLVSFTTPPKEIRSLLDEDVASAGFVRGAR